MRQTFVMDFDDLELAKSGLDMIFKLKEHYPNFKVNLFMIPIPQAILNGNSKPDEYKEWAKYLKTDWIEICPHGLMHFPAEMEYYETKKSKRKVTYKQANEIIDAAEHTFKQLDLPFKKIWKSPHWQTSPETYRALWERGYTVAVDPNQDIPEGKVYTYNWSVENPIPHFPVVKGHGHMWDKSPNVIHKCMHN